MRLKLNILPHGECAQVFVYADPHEESFLNWRVFKIWHNNKSGSMTPVFSHENYINDYYITFSSKIPFKLFCERFWNSPFIKSENYRFLTHNCSNAAVYALQLAEIKISVPRLTLMRIHPFLIGIPGPFLSPLDLFYRSKNFKIKTLENTPLPLQSVDFKLELARSRLTFWSKSNNNKTLASNVRTMVSEIKKEATSNKHQSELYLEALIKTIDLISHENNEASRQDYCRFITQFKKRESTSKMDKAVTHFMLFSNVMISLSTVLFIAGLEDWRVDASFYLGTAFFCARILKGIQADKNSTLPLYQIKDTPLSLAMQQVAAEAETDFRPKLSE